MASLETFSHVDAGEPFLSGGFSAPSNGGLPEGGPIIQLELGVMGNEPVALFMATLETHLKQGRSLEESFHYAAILGSLEYRHDGKSYRSLLQSGGRFIGLDAVLMADDDGSAAKFFEVCYESLAGDLLVSRGEWLDLVDGRLRLLTERGVREFPASAVRWSRNLDDYTVQGKMLDSRTLQLELRITRAGLLCNWSVRSTYPSITRPSKLPHLDGI